MYNTGENNAFLWGWPVLNAIITELFRTPHELAARGNCRIDVDATGKAHVWCAERIEVKHSTSYTYRISYTTNGELRDFTLNNIHLSHPLVSFFPDGRSVVVSQRHYRATIENNAWIVDERGVILSSFRTHDAVSSVQVTRGGNIWISYFDETDAGQLDCYDQFGRNIFDYYSFSEQHNLAPIGDCYAMNASDDEEVWICYYPEFPLVHISHFTQSESWAIDAMAGTRAFAVDGQSVLFAGNHIAADTLTLGDLHSGDLENVQTITSAGEVIHLPSPTYIGRGDIMYVSSSDRLYRIDIHSLKSGL